MQQSEIQRGERRREPRKRKVGRKPALLPLIVLTAFAALGFGTPAVSAEAPPASVEAPPVILPSDAATSASGKVAGSESRQWIVGGVPGPGTASIAASTGATAIDEEFGSYRINRGAARALARRLDRADRLVYAEPDVAVTRSGYPLDLFSDQQWWLNRIVSPGDVTPPEVTPESPLIALVEESIDPLHPDLVNASLTGAKSLGADADWHGTAVAGIAASPGEMLGIRGVWPGARMQLFPSGLKCSTASAAVASAAENGAAVINMSYTFPSGSCFTHFKATQYAVKLGSLPVAAAGNSGATGNAPMRPATDPHVVSVGAVDAESAVASFSTRNSGVDITAPGQSVLAPIVSNATDPAGNTVVERRWEPVSGTSFSAPMVSAAAAWLGQARPALDSLQISRLLTTSATDLGAPGRDPEYGEGMLSIERSLAAPTPADDPFEPNDDIRWINGSLIKPRAPFLWKPGKGKLRKIQATLSRDKDPADVYAVKIPAGRKITVNVAQMEGDVSLAAMKPKARSILRPRKNLIVRSNRRFPKTEGILIRNLKKKPQKVWVVLTPSPATSEQYQRYRITVTTR